MTDDYIYIGGYMDLHSKDVVLEHSRNCNFKKCFMLVKVKVFKVRLDKCQSSRLASGRLRYNSQSGHNDALTSHPGPPLGFFQDGWQTLVMGVK